MNNPLYNDFQQQQAGGNILQQFRQFCQGFRGDPQQKIQELMNSGKVSQQQYNGAVQMAQRFKWLLGGK